MSVYNKTIFSNPGVFSFSTRFLSTTDYSSTVSKKSTFFDRFGLSKSKNKDTVSKNRIFLSDLVYVVRIRRFKYKRDAHNKSDFVNVKDLRSPHDLLVNRSRGFSSYTETYNIARSAFWGTMVLDLLLFIKNSIDPTLSFRRSCREGICGSCAMNINGHNTLACLKELPPFTGLVNSIHSGTKSVYLDISGLPHAKPLRDLIPDVRFFYKHYKSVAPWLITTNTAKKDPKTVITNSSKGSVFVEKQSRADRAVLDGLYECILCLCCSHSCPSYWWNSDQYLGPAILLQAYRWVADSRDISTRERLASLSVGFRLYACHSILSCTKTCPKHLNPAAAISKLKVLVDKLS